MGSIVKRCTGKGVTRYRALVKRKGVGSQYKTFGRKGDALAWIRATESALDRGVLVEPKPVSAAIFTRFDAAINRLSAAHVARLDSAAMAYWIQCFGILDILTIDRVLISKQSQILSTKLSPATVMKYLATLSSILAALEKDYGILPDNPCRHIRKPAVSNARCRVLSDSELERLMLSAVTDPELLTIIKIALSTGFRKGEILGLTWDRVDMAASVLYLATSKNGSKHSGVMIEAVRSDLIQGKGTSGLVFCSQFGRKLNIDYRWRKVVKDAKLEDFRFHDLRHTAASHWLARGLSLFEVSRLLNHKTITITQRYAHLDIGNLLDKVR